MGNTGSLMTPKLTAFSPFTIMFSSLPKLNFDFLSHVYFVVCKCFHFGPV